MCLNKTSSERAAEEEMQSLSAALTELAFLVLYAYPGVRSLTGPYPPGYVPAGLSAPYALSGLVFVIDPCLQYPVSPWLFPSFPRDLKIALPVLQRLSVKGGAAAHLFCTFATAPFEIRTEEDYFFFVLSPFALHASVTLFTRTGWGASSGVNSFTREFRISMTFVPVSGANLAFTVS